MKISKLISFGLFLLSICLLTSLSVMGDPFDNESTNSGSLEGVYETPVKGGYAHYYVRHEGNKVYGVALNFDGDFACAFQGEVYNNRVVLDWMSLPYGTFVGEGEVTFALSHGGTVWTEQDTPVAMAVTPYRHTQLKKIRRGSKIPSQRRAQFEGSGLSDITKAYQGEQRIFLRQKGNKVVFYGESFRTKENGDRPGMACVFFGTRSGNTFSGNWLTIPLGHAPNYGGAATFKIIGPDYFRMVKGYYPGVAYRKF